MNIGKSLKFGTPIYLPQLEEAYAVAQNGKCDPNFLAEFGKIIEYARCAPNRNYRYEIGRLISQYYTHIAAMIDPVFIGMHKALFGPVSDTIDVSNLQAIENDTSEYYNTFERKLAILNSLRIQ